MAVTAKSIDAYLKRKGSPLAGLGSVFMAQGPRVASLLVAIAGAESSFGRVNSGSHNAWGWGPGRDFPSWQAAIQSIGQGLKSGYLAEGRNTIPLIGAKWAPQGAANDPTNLNSHWVQNVRKFYRELGAGKVSGGAVSPSVALGGANIGSGAPVSSGGLQDAAFQNLSAIASGRYDPLEALTNLTSSAPQVTLDPRGTLSPPKRTGRPAPAGAGSIIDFAQAQIGQPYVWGGESRSEGGFDCSGLIQAAYAKAGISIPRTTWDQMKGGKKVGWNQLRPGDLVFSNGGGHVVMYVGGGKVIAAPRRGTVVQYQPLSRFKNSFVGARRYL